MRTLYLAIALLVVTACKRSDRDRQLDRASTSTGCEKDTDCKGDRVCAKGTCISPLPTVTLSEATNEGTDPTRPVLPKAEENFTDEKGGWDWGNKCWTSIVEKRWGHAKAQCNAAMALSPQSPQPKSSLLYYLGLIAEAAGDYKKARGLMTDSLALRDSSEVRASLARVGGPSGSPRANSKAGVPTFELVAHDMARASDLVEFLGNSTHRVVFIDAWLPEKAAAIEGASMQSSDFTIWGDCQRPVPVNKTPNAIEYGCTGTEYAVAADTRGDTGLRWYRGSWRLEGYFAVGPLVGPYQGLMAGSLRHIPVEQVPIQ